MTIQFTLEDANGAVKAQGTLTAGLNSWIIGRDRCDIDLKDATAAPHHALLMLSRSGDLVVRDLACRSDVFVNGVPVLASPVRSGDKVRVGTALLRFTMEGSPARRTPPPLPKKMALRVAA